MDDAVNYANNVVGPNQTVINKNGVVFYVFSNSNWTWRLEHHITTTRLPQTHINL